MSVNWSQYYNPKTNTAILTGSWSGKRFNKMKESLCVKQFSKIIIDDGAKLRLTSEQIDDFEIRRYGQLVLKDCIVHNINNAGVIRANNSTIVKLENDGQVTLNNGCRLIVSENFRHLSSSRSYIFNLRMAEHCSVRATSSYIIRSTADLGASLYLASSLVLGGTGELSYWTRPVFNDPGIRKHFTADAVLKFAAIELISRSESVIDANHPLAKSAMVKTITRYVANGATLPWNIAKDLVSFADVFNKPTTTQLRMMVGYKYPHTLETI
jgi:hypothetical protein